MKVLKMSSTLAGHWKLNDNNQLRRSSMMNLLQLHQKLPKNSMSILLWSFGIWCKLERWKNSICGCLMNWPKKKKIIVLKCHLLLLYATTNHLLIGLWHVTKSGFYTTTGNDLLSGWTKKKLQSTFQSQTCTKKRSWSLSWWCAAHLIYYSSLNPGVKKPLHLRSMLSKSMRRTETAMPAASTGQLNGPNSSPWQCLTIHCKTNSSKVERTGLRSFASTAT